METADFRLNKARIKLQGRNPFFSYLSLYIKFIKDEKGRVPEYAGMGISPDGELFYKEEWVDKLSDEEIIGVLCHEISHLAFLHLIRKGNRVHIKWNLTTDLAINTMLEMNGFILPDGIKRDSVGNDTFTLKMREKNGKMKNYVVKDVSKKTAEAIYDELPDFKFEESGGGSGKESDVCENGKNWDNHENKELMTEEEKQKREDEWLGRMEEAYASAKMRGKLPLGIGLYVDELHKSQVDWKVLLQKFVVALLPVDYTWAKPSKKSIAVGTYLPSTYKEKIDIVVSVDMSGSIGTKERTDFLSEIIGIARAYSNAMSMILLIHDTDIHNEYDIKNGNIEKIKKLEFKGGGGTSHKCIFEKIAEKYKRCQALVSFTDGYSDLENIKLDDYKFTKIFVISKGGSDEAIKNKRCVVVNIK